MSDDVARKIFNLNTLLRNYVEKSSLKDVSLNLTQIRIMQYLRNHEDEDIIQKDLEAETNLNKASITGTLDSLQDKGLIVRVQADNDRRKNIIKLTQKAKDIFNDMDDTIESLNKKILYNVSEEELTTISNVGDKIMTNLKMEMENNGFNN